MLNLRAHAFTIIFLKPEHIKINNSNKQTEYVGLSDNALDFYLKYTLIESQPRHGIS
jgi:hypothetical protein